MKSDEPGRAQGKELSSSGGGVAIRGSSSGEQLIPDNSGDSAASNLVPSQPVSSDADSPTLVDATLVSAGVIAGEAAAGAPAHRPQSDPTHSGLAPGTVIAQRYQILDVLGEGGMGAVYKANDRELSRMVALKVIRPDLARNPGIVERFKQELRLSHQVTHKNVIRIYDLGEGEGVKFITMEYIEGKDLRSLIREKKRFAPEEAVEVIQQVCQALDAAHSVGVIHRDLKPQNIMQDRSGRILVMDFGLARTLEGEGMTQTGALVGTMEYMSPEQALGKELDQRSDIFSLGLICYELLTGKMPFVAESALASLIKRTQERAIPVSDVDNQIPGALSGIVSKCLERDLSNRYQSVSGVLADLNTWKDKRAAGTIKFNATVKPWGQTLPWPLIAGIVTALALAIGGYTLRDQLFRSSPSKGSVSAGPAVSLAILPFRNASGDQTLDWLGPSLADMLSTDVGQSAHLRTISPDRLHQVLTDLQITSNVVIDPTMLRRIAEFTSADTVVWGQYAKFGDQIRIDATLQDLKHDRRVPLKIDVSSEKDVPGGVDRLADSIRQNLGMSSDVVKELRASAFQPTSKSIPALRDYNEGVKLLRDDKSLDAQKRLEAATKEDPTFALGFSKLAQTYANLGYDSEAQRSAQKAVELSDNLPQAERYLIAAIRAQIANNYPEAIRAYENLAKASPDNADVQSALGRLYEDSADFAKANEYYQKLLKANPKDIAAIVSTGRVAIKSGKAQESLDPLNRALSLSIQLGNDAERSASLYLIGLAYRLLNKPEDALRNFQEALAIRRRTGEKREIAFCLNEMAVVEVSLGKSKDALAHYQDAMQVRREIGDKRGLGDTLIDLGNFLDDRGEHDQALKMYKEALQFERDIGDEGLQAACLNNIGAVYFEKAQYEDARTYYQQALQLREKSKVSKDIVNSVFNLAEVSVRMGEYDQAVVNYMHALELHRSMNDDRGAAIDAYTLGTMYDYQGRFGAAVKSKQDAFNTFQNLKDKTNWMADIQGGYGESLVLAGRGEDAKAHLTGALSLARDLKNDGLVAQILGFQGDTAYYRGDSKSAHELYDQALQAAIRSKEPERILSANVNLAQVTLQEGQVQQAVASLRKLMQQADEHGVPNASAECQIYAAEAMIRNHDNAHAQQELGRALLRTDKIGLKPLSAKAHFLLGTALRETGNRTEALQEYRSTVQFLDDMRKEPGADKILLRSDFKTMYDEATRWSQAKN